MPTQKKFEETLDTLEKYVEEIGDELVESNIEDIASGTVHDEEYSLIGHHCEGDKESMYVVAGHPDLRFFTVLYFFSIERYVGTQLPDNQINDILNKDEKSRSNDETDFTDEERYHRQKQVGRLLIERLSDADRAALESYIFMMISSDNNKLFINTRKNSINEFTIETRIFPYEERFSISFFYEAVESTVSAGRRGTSLMERTLFVQVDEEDPYNTELELNFGW